MLNHVNLYKSKLKYLNFYILFIILNYVLIILNINTNGIIFLGGEGQTGSGVHDARDAYAGLGLRDTSRH